MTNGNGTPVELLPLAARLWREVDRKAAAVAERRTGELVHDHVYRYHPDGIGGGGGGEDTGPWVDEAGDTMTGTLDFEGVDVAAGGAVRVTGGVSATGHLYGPDSPPYAPAVALAADDEQGIEFSVTAPRYLVALRWYRNQTTLPVPAAVRLWDSTAPGAPVRVWTATDYPAFADTAVGWKEQPLDPADLALLVSGRTHTLSYTPGSNAQRGHAAYTPVPVAGLTFLRFVFDPTAGARPTTSLAVATSLDADIRQSIAAEPAAVGAIRLPNGLPGIIAWRNAANNGDHTLTVSADDELVFDGVPLAGGGGTGNTTMHTQTTAPTGAPNSLWFNPSEAA